MRTEFAIPILYSAQREVLRFDIPLRAGWTRMISGLFRSSLWVPVYALIVTGTYVDPGTYARLLVQLLAFVITYEIGYLITDNIGIRFEKGRYRKEVYPEPVPIASVLGAVAIRLAVLLLCFALFPSVFSRQIVIGHLLTLSVFALHCFVPEKLRIGTFVALRILKNSVPFLALLVLLPVADRWIVLAGIVGVTLYYTAHYSSLKLERTLHVDFDFFRLANSLLVIPLSWMVLGVLAIFVDVPPRSFGILAFALLMNQLALSLTGLAKRYFLGRWLSRPGRQAELPRGPVLRPRGRATRRQTDGPRPISIVADQTAAAGSQSSTAVPREAGQSVGIQDRRSDLIGVAPELARDGDHDTA